MPVCTPPTGRKLRLVLVLVLVLGRLAIHAQGQGRQ
jgi:hypothetical protein